MNEEIVRKIKKVEKDIKNGDKTPNQVRTENGLPPLNKKNFDQKLTKKD